MMKLKILASSKKKNLFPMHINTPLPSFEWTQKGFGDSFMNEFEVVFLNAFCIRLKFEAIY